MQLGKDGVYVDAEASRCQTFDVKQLVSSIVLRAIWDYGARDTGYETETARQDAKGWLFQSDEIIVDNDGFTLAACCQILGLPIEQVRRIALTKQITADMVYSTKKGRKHRIKRPSIGLYQLLA